MPALDLIWFVLCLGLLALGGQLIVRAAAGLAQRWGMSGFRAGLLLVAFGTSLPELAVNLRAVATGAPELALGTAVGSTLANLGLTLGAAALAASLLIRARLLAPLLVVLAVAGMALMIFGLDGVLGRGEGLWLLLGFVAALLFLQRAARRESEPVRVAIAAAAVTRTGLVLNLLRLALAVAALYIGARGVVQVVPGLGQALGWSPLLVGLLPVAIGLALPEMAAAIAAARRGHGDMVLGHVLGASLFNLLVIVGGMVALQPLPLPASFVRLELPAVIAFCVALYPMLRGDLQISRREGGVLLLAFVGWVALELMLLH